MKHALSIEINNKFYGGRDVFRNERSRDSKDVGNE